MEYNLSENVDWVVQALKFKLGWMMGIGAWRAALAWTYGLFSKVIAEAIESMIPEDRDWANKLFNKRLYRVFCVFVRVLTTVQLPKFATGKANGNTELYTRSQVMKAIKFSKEEETKPNVPPPTSENK